MHEYRECSCTQTKQPLKYQINILWEAVEAAVAAAAAVGHYCSEMWDSSLKSWRKQLFKLPPALHRVMVVWVVEFSKEGYKIIIFLPKINVHQGKCFFNCNGKVSKLTKFDLQSQFLCQKSLEYFWIFLRAHFCF